MSKRKKTSNSGSPAKAQAKPTPAVSEQLRAIIKDAIDGGTTLNAVAVAAGIPYPMLWRFVNGDDMRLATADRLCQYFGAKLTTPRARKQERTR